MRKIDLEKFDWEKIQTRHNEGVNFSDLCIEFCINATVLRRASNEGKFIRNKSIYRMSERNRNDASERMKKLRRSGIGNITHKKSPPCEKLKEILKLKGYSFEEELMVVPGRLFRIDIAFPTLKVGIEVNGNQHYDKDGKLKLYYQERHDLIVKEGWKLIEIHYSLCYNEQAVNHLIETWFSSSIG